MRDRVAPGRAGEVPAHLADLPVVAEQADVANFEALRGIAARHEVTGIVHLAGYPAPRGSGGGVDATQRLLDGLLNVVRLAQDCGAGRIALASTIGVYAGLTHDGPLTEGFLQDQPTSTPSRIASVSGSQRTNLSAVLRGLEARDLIRRRPTAGDGRVVEVVLTDRGTANYEIVRREWGTIVQSAATGTHPAELAAALALLAEIDAGLAGWRQA